MPLMWSPTPRPAKTNQGHARKLKPCGLLRNPMAKVELRVPPKELFNVLSVKS